MTLLQLKRMMKIHTKYQQQYWLLKLYITKLVLLIIVCTYIELHSYNIESSL